MPLFAKWKGLIVYLLEDRNNYVRTSDAISLTNDSAILTFERDSFKFKNKIEVTILDSGELIALRFSSPMTLGYNEFSFGEYFYSLQFQTPSSYGKPGLEYNEVNIEGVKSILKQGVKGKEVQYFKEGKMLKSEVHFEGRVSFPYKYDFSERTFWQKVLGKKVVDFENIQSRIIELNEVFPPLFVD